jgi:hypothetical protein
MRSSYAGVWIAAAVVAASGLLVACAKDSREPKLENDAPLSLAAPVGKLQAGGSFAGYVFDYYLEDGTRCVSVVGVYSTSVDCNWEEIE